MFMEIEHNNNSGYVRCWLNENEKEQVLDHYSDDATRKLALMLMLKSGLRVREVPRVRKTDVSESDAGFYVLTVRESKTGTRQTILDDETKNMIDASYSFSDRSSDQPCVPKSKRTIQRWVTSAGEELAEQTGDANWEHLSCHDLRRTWATTMLSAGVSDSLTMKYGGWDNHDTLQEHYVRMSDEQVAKQLNEAGVL